MRLGDSLSCRCAELGSAKAGASKGLAFKADLGGADFARSFVARTTRLTPTGARSFSVLAPVPGESNGSCTKSNGSVAVVPAAAVATISICR